MENQFSCSIVHRRTIQHTSSLAATVQFRTSNQSITASTHRKTQRGRLRETYVVAAVAGEGEEVDLVAVADAAVLPQVGELRRAHTGRGAPRARPPVEPSR